MTRATSLGEFSPMVRLFTLDSVLNITEVAQIFKATFFSTEPVMYYLVLTKNGWAAFWAIFSPTHLVTLEGSP
jgi:hypothetical protein